MDTENLRTAFNNYANKATGQLESRMFVKLFKQAGLLNSKFTANDVDVIFVKHRTKIPTQRFWWRKRVLPYTRGQKPFPCVCTTIKAATPAFTPTEDHRSSDQTTPSSCGQCGCVLICYTHALKHT
ncbi:hypothetical protein, conserved [Babesia bigemina]|uniref:Uncharacterized protein n=1 Tax=Babesia bigemina TaxID=5866 RepID=A0A061D0H8_BABBI|nr:hypothetical protein, conserved [Babesia bigemina]CDR94296.1 hypothetical protein, conserved [Babesia bigemina]|eukprot:XP_012766482.1 hypothetical protein, conserved [Babesia bigemina]